MRHLTASPTSIQRTADDAGACRAVLAAALLAAGLSGCSSMNEALQGDRVDYRAAATKVAPLDIPPDLTQLARDARYAPQSGQVNASSYQAAAPATAAAAAAPVVAARAVGPVRVERAGDERWLVVNLPPEQLWPQLRAFWQERGLPIVQENLEAGVMETDWAENRAKLPNDFIRNTVGKVLDSLYSTGERDKFRTRVERTATGSEVYITHRGMQEVFTSKDEDATKWTPRPSDPTLESEFLARLMVKLGSREEDAHSAVANATPQAARARLVAGQAAPTMQVDDPLDQAWRRVGIALDRGGFTVEDRDRASGTYFVRYIEPSAARKDEPGFLGRLFSFGRSDTTAQGAVRYRIALTADGNRTLVAVQNAQGGPETGGAGQRIVSLLVDDLK